MDDSYLTDLDAEVEAYGRYDDPVFDINADSVQNSYIKINSYPNRWIVQTDGNTGVVFEKPCLMNEDDNLFAEAEAKAVGAMFVRAREGTETSQRAAAKKTGIDPKNLRQIENGTTDPSLRTIQKIANGMGYDVELRLIPKGS